MSRHQNQRDILQHLRRKKSAIINSIKTESAIINSQYWSNLLDELSRERLLNPKSFWRKIKPIIFKSKEKFIRLTDTGNRHGQLLTTPADIESKFREEMEAKYTPPPRDKIDRTIFRNTTNFHLDNPNLTVPRRFIDITRLVPGHPLIAPFRPAEVANTLKSFKNRAPGADAIKRVHTDHFPKVLIVIITQLMNYCLATGYYPKNFKSGIIIFINKPDKDPSIAKNYRPITLLNIIGKAFGKLVNRRFVSHLEAGNHLNPHQYGFRKGRGCESSLALTYEFACRHKSDANNYRISVVSRDISGAFDRVWHERLMKLFHHLDLHPLFIKLLCNFLTRREIRIKIGAFIGPAFTPRAGVPQGAPDSPDIFNITTLPLGNTIPTHSCYMPWYADDLHMVVATRCGRRGQPRHEDHILEAIQNQDFFERTRGILTCPEKSVITAMGQHHPDFLEYDQGVDTIRYNYLKGGETTKILGLNISNRSWTAHHSRIAASKANTITSLLYSARGMSQKDKLYLVKTLIMPTLTYPCVPLNTCSIACFAKLQAALNRALRFVFGVRFPAMPTARSLLHRAKIKPINQVLHKRAQNLWRKLELGTAGDIGTYNLVSQTPIAHPHFWYPSSLNRARMELPPPIFTAKDSATPEVAAYYDWRRRVN